MVSIPLPPSLRRTNPYELGLPVVSTPPNGVTVWLPVVGSPEPIALIPYVAGDVALPESRHDDSMSRNVHHLVTQGVPPAQVPRHRPTPRSVQRSSGLRLIVKTSSRPVHALSIPWE